MILVLRSAHWRLEYDPATGTTVTTYACGAESIVGLNADHEWHAVQMREGGCEWMTAGLFNLMHETSHHLVGAVLPTVKEGGCFIIYHSAHKLPRPWPKEMLRVAKVAEFAYRSVQYHAIGQEHHGGEALVWLRWLGVDIEGICKTLRRVADAGREAAQPGLSQ